METAHVTPPRRSHSPWLWVAIIGSVVVLSGTVAVIAFAALGLGYMAGQVDAKPPLPIELASRQAVLGPGLVLQIKNTSSRYLTVVLQVENPTLRSSTTHNLALQPNFTNEFGWAEGVRVASGDRVTITHAEYLIGTWIIP